MHVSNKKVTSVTLPLPWWQVLKRLASLRQVQQDSPNTSLNAVILEIMESGIQDAEYEVRQRTFRSRTIPPQTPIESYGCIYFLRGEKGLEGEAGVLKIGFSRSVLSRLRSHAYSVGKWGDLTFLGWIEGTDTSERELRLRLEPFRAQGCSSAANRRNGVAFDWFDMSPEVTQLLDSLQLRTFADLQTSAYWGIGEVPKHGLVVKTPEPQSGWRNPK